MTDYSNIVAGAKWDGSTLTASVPAEWAQGRTIFGGLTVGLSLQAFQQRIEQPSRLRSAMTSFVAPVRVGEVAIATNILRTGRNVTHVEATISQDDAVCSRVLACYGNDRESPIQVDPRTAPRLPAPEELQPIPFMPGLSPDFARYVDYRWTPESIPYMASGNGSASGYIRLHESCTMRVDLFALLVDAWPSPALSMLTAPSPVSSLTWNLELLQADDAYRSDDWWTVHATIDTTVNGYVHGSAYMWAAGGTLVARSMQTVSIYQRG